ncbi:MAG TPA: FAD-binding protein, partial [Cellulomonas sp.]|nr:FAD-binding protein [Cellulomonas sp.]
RFMPDVHPMAELAPRDVVARAILGRMAQTGADHVWLDTRHLGAEFLRKRFPTINERLLEHGIDMATELIPVAPAQHYHSGGVVADLVGRTTITGLYAVGEMACTGVHGANRLASNSLLEGLVFATRAARHIAARVADGSLPQLVPHTRPGAEALVAAASRARVQRIASDGPGPLRSGDGLRTALAALDRVPTDAHHRQDDGRMLAAPQVAEWETTNIHQVATALTLAALTREESRGGHVRTDFPAPADEWRVRLELSLDPTGHLTARRAPLS